MIIKVDNLKEFKNFILDSVDNEENKIRIMHSSNNITGTVFLKDDNDFDYTDFTFVLLSPIYDVVYSKRQIKNENYQKILDELLGFRDKNGLPFKVQKFKNIEIKNNTSQIKVEEKLNVI